MIRTLSLLSALVAAALAVQFDNLILYVAAGVFLVVFLVVVFGLARRRRPSAARLPTAPAGGGDDLESLGILEVRPKGASSAPAPAHAPAEADASVAQAPAPAAVLPEEPAAPPSGPTRSIVRVKTAPPRQDPDVVTPEQEAQATVNHLLHALLHATGAQTTGLLREETTTSRRYHIDLIVSRNAFARAEGAFVARVPFVEPGQHTPVLHTIGDALSAAALRYYREELAIHKLLAVALTYHGAPYVLFADAMEDDLLATPRARYLLESTARFIEQVGGAGTTDLPPLVEAPAAPASSAQAAPPASVPDEEPTPGPAPELSEPAPAEPRPRREIIAEEMAADRDFALALVHHHADDEGALDIQERALEAALEAAFPDTRVERFGDLTFGAFLRGTVESVEQQVGAGYALLTERLPHRVSIGAAYVTEAHETPEALRSDATDALQKSYETGQPILVG